MKNNLEIIFLGEKIRQSGIWEIQEEGGKGL